MAINFVLLGMILKSHSDSFGSLYFKNSLKIDFIKKSSDADFKGFNLHSCSL